ncbi:MAG TPA: tryptophan 2,3-dioxygenase family protein [Thermoanaerobaculia bacterium]|jgi:tryptophan 2,3-dioxygenase|nr:tryptophan 2,3-dioxygenase family protein [Thermoanaerobaculia bacterium]
MTTFTDAGNRLTYASYLHVPELLSLQRELSQPAHHDELLFITSHQVYELWFKQMLHEVVAVCEWLDRDEPLRAAQLFDRLHAILHLLIEQIPLLETMFAVDFAKFRDNLRPASGFQSVQFRRLEFLCGAKNPRMIDLVGEDEPSRRELAAALRQPTLYDHFLRHLARSGFPIPAAVLERDVSQPHQPDEGVVDALLSLYQESDRHYQHFRLAEHLLQLDERFAIWRFHHVKMVERMIGAKTGTGGSSGAKYLSSTLGSRFFPEIWQVRDRLTSGYGG